MRKAEEEEEEKEEEEVTQAMIAVPALNGVWWLNAAHRDLIFPMFVLFIVLIQL